VKRGITKDLPSGIPGEFRKHLNALIRHLGYTHEMLVLGTTKDWSKINLEIIRKLLNVLTKLSI